MKKSDRRHSAVGFCGRAHQSAVKLKGLGSLPTVSLKNDSTNNIKIK